MVSSKNQAAIGSFFKNNVGPLLSILIIICGFIINYFVSQATINYQLVQLNEKMVEKEKRIYDRIDEDVRKITFDQAQKWDQYQERRLDRSKYLDSENARQDEKLKALEDKIEPINNLQYRVTAGETLMKEMNNKVDNLSEAFAKASLAMGNQLAGMTEQMKNISGQLNAIQSADGARRK